MSEDQVAVVKAAIIAELMRQAETVYFWDDADRDLFDEEPVEYHREYLDHEGKGVQMTNKFDMDLVAQAAIAAIERVV